MIEKIDTSKNQPKMTIADAADFLGISAQGMHKQIKAKNLSCPKLGNKSYITHIIAKHLFGLNFEKLKIAVQIVKGGTGKTTTLDNIACCANTYGAKVLLIDTDPQGNLTDAHNIDADEVPVLIDVIKGDASIQDSIVPLADGLDLIPSRIENVILDNEIINNRLPLDKLYANLLKPIENDYDIILFDCPPTMGQAVTAASLYVDIILAPLNPDKYSAKGLKILRNEIETLNDNYQKSIIYKIYLNKFSGKTILSDKAIMSLLSDPSLEGIVLKNMVQFSQEIPNLIDDCKNVFSVLKKSPVRDDFDRLTRELLNISPESIKDESLRLNRVEKQEKVQEIV